MPIQTSDNLKTFFETGKRPTEAQFADLIDSLRHKNSLIAINEVDGLVNILNSLPTISAIEQLLQQVQPVQRTAPAGGGTISLPPALMYSRVLIIGAAGTVVNIGTDVGINDICDGLMLTTGSVIHYFGLYAPDGKYLYIDGNSEAVTCWFFRN
ncbi:MAG TPA: hypothetical protein PKD90_04440 [Phnomibacter sp.]|nr:hypothetical protein [Phnomibacter sp.]